MKRLKHCLILGLAILVAIISSFATLTSSPPSAHADMTSDLAYIQSQVNSADFTTIQNASSNASCIGDVATLLKNGFDLMNWVQFYFDCGPNASSIITHTLGTYFYQAHPALPLPPLITPPNPPAIDLGSPSDSPSAQISYPTDPTLETIYGTLAINWARTFIGLSRKANDIFHCGQDLALILSWSSITTLATLDPLVAAIVVSDLFMIKTIIDCGTVLQDFSTTVNTITSNPQANIRPGGLFCPGPNISSLACMNTSESSGGSTPPPSGSGTPTPTPSPTTPPPSCSVTSTQTALFTDTNFGGQCVVLNPGAYNDPTAMNIPNDSVSSVRVGGDAQLELCRDAGLSNTCQWFTADNADLSTTSIGAKQASSAQVISLSQYVTVCSSTNYQGTCKSFGPGVVNDLSAYGLSGNIQSIEVSAAVTLYLNDGVNLSGQPGIFNANVADLSANGWANRAKSLKIERTHNTSCNNDPSQNGVLLYRNTNFDVGGGCILLTSDNNDLGQLDFTQGSSLQFVGNYVGHYQATIYIDANFGTACGSFFLNQSDLRNCAGKTASIRIQPFTPPTQADNIAPMAYRDHPGSDAAVDNNLSTDWVAGHAVPLGFVFAQPQTIQDIVIFDRSQNSPDNNQINKVEIVFSDGTVINNIDMTSGGPRCADVAFSPKTVQWVNIVPIDSSGNNGYKEVQIWDTSGSVYSQNNCVMKYQLSAVAGSGPAPLMQNIPSQVMDTSYAIQEGVTGTISIVTVNPGNSPLTLSASNLPPFATFTDNNNGTGSINLAPQLGDAGPPYTVTIQASNGTLTSTGTVTIIVNPEPGPNYSSCPSPWSCADIGSPALTGDQSVNVNTWTVQGAGGDIWNASDQFHYVWQSLTGDGSMSARVISQANTDVWAKAGIMFRQSSAANDVFYMLAVTPGNGVDVMYRASPGANAVRIAQVMLTTPVYLQVSRSGNTFSAATSSDGITWTPVAGSSVTLTVNSLMLVGLAVSSHNTGALSAVTFDNASVSTGGQPFQSCSTTWACADLGNPNLAGSDSVANGVWTVQGDGNDIWSTGDQFHYDWQTLAGDGSVSAHVTSQTNTDSWAKAGVMLRQDTSTDAAYYLAALTPGNGIVVQYRTSKGASAQMNAQMSGAAPIYLEVIRSGNTFTAYTSSDGVNWTLMAGSGVTLSVSGSMLAGLAVVSHAAALSTVTFDTVSISSPSNQTPTPTASPSPTATSTPSPTPSPTATVTPSPTPTTMPPYTVYDEGLAPNWGDWSWCSNNNLQDTSHPYTGNYDLSWTVTCQWGGLALHLPSGFDCTSYGYLTFALEASQPGQKVQVSLYDQNGNTGIPVQLDSYGGTPVAGNYTVYTIPLSAFQSTTVITGILIQDVSGNATEPPMYVDTILFE